MSDEPVDRFDTVKPIGAFEEKSMSIVRHVAFGFLGAAAMSSAAAVASPAEIAANAGCMLCHAGKETAALGPPFSEIAARYAGQSEAADKLFVAVREGSTGTWGEMPMMPVYPEQVSDDDLRAVIAWLLEQES